MVIKMGNAMKPLEILGLSDQGIWTYEERVSCCYSEKTASSEFFYILPAIRAFHVEFVAKVLFRVG